MKKLRIGLWIFVLLAAIIFIALNLPEKGKTDGVALTPIAGFNQGSHFTLTDHNGEIFNSQEQLGEGEYGLLFFGFTHCPAICPTELQKFAVVMDSLPDNVAAKVTPIFITIDPERDTTEMMKEYVPLFHDRIIGLTGDLATIHQTLNDWKIFFTKIDDPSLSEYTMDHSTYSYLVDHEMQILGLYRLKTSADEITDHIIKTVSR